MLKSSSRGRVRLKKLKALQKQKSITAHQRLIEQSNGRVLQRIEELKKQRETAAELKKKQAIAQQLAQLNAVRLLQQKKLANLKKKQKRPQQLKAPKINLAKLKQKQQQSALLKLSPNEKLQMLSWLDLERNAEILAATDAKIKEKMKAKQQADKLVLEALDYDDYYDYDDLTDEEIDEILLTITGQVPGELDFDYDYDEYGDLLYDYEDDIDLTEILGDYDLTPLVPEPEPHPPPVVPPPGPGYHHPPPGPPSATPAPGPNYNPYPHHTTYGYPQAPPTQAPTVIHTPSPVIHNHFYEPHDEPHYREEPHHPPYHDHKPHYTPKPDYHHYSKPPPPPPPPPPKPHYSTKPPYHHHPPPKQYHPTKPPHYEYHHLKPGPPYHDHEPHVPHHGHHHHGSDYDYEYYDTYDHTPPYEFHKTVHYHTTPKPTPRPVYHHTTKPPVYYSTRKPYHKPPPPVYHHEPPPEPLPHPEPYHAPHPSPHYASSGQKFLHDLSAVVDGAEIGLIRPREVGPALTSTLLHDIQHRVRSLNPYSELEIGPEGQHHTRVHVGHTADPHPPFPPPGEAHPHPPIVDIHPKSEPVGIRHHHHHRHRGPPLGPFARSSSANQRTDVGEPAIKKKKRKKSKGKLKPLTAKVPKNLVPPNESLSFSELMSDFFNNKPLPFKAAQKTRNINKDSPPHG